MTNHFEYLNYKLITSIINDDILEKICETHKHILLDIRFITCMDVFCEVYIVQNKLDYEQVRRFKELINYVRENIELPKEKYLSMINKMIASTNQTDYSNKQAYLVENYICRFKGHDFYKVFNPFSIPSIVEKIKVSTSKDYFFLMLLTELTDEEFNNGVDFAILDEYFLLSVNQLISENRELLKNARFVNRIRIIADKNIKNINEVELKNEKRIIYKESKYYFKHLKGE